jgi:hypothetical protein
MALRKHRIFEAGIPGSSPPAPQSPHHISPPHEFSLNSVTIINDFYNFVVIQKRMTIQI